MRHRFYISAVLLVCFISVMFSQKHYKELQYAQLGDITFPVPEESTLDNGMILLLLEDHELPLIKIKAEYVTGSIYNPSGKTGLARLTGEVMRVGGSVNMPGDRMDEELEEIAAVVETWISDVSGGAYLFTHKDHFDKVLSIFADVLMNPSFSEEKIDLKKIEAKSEISRRNDDVSDISRREFNQIIYRGSPFWRDEEYFTIDAITRDDMVQFHKEWVKPNRMVLGVWGDFKTKDMINRLKKIFNSWKAGEGVKQAIPEIPYKYEKTINLVEKTDVNQSNIYIGHLGGEKDNPDYAALIMMNEVLSGGFSSRLFSRLRSDRGLAYQIYGAYGTNYQYPGVFYMLSSTKSGRTVEAIESMLKELKLMTEDLVSEEELKVAKEGWMNSFVFNFDNMDEIMGRLITYKFNDYPVDFLQKTKDAIEKVTREDILRVAKKYLHPDKVHILTVGNPEEFDQPLSVLGEVNVIDISIPTP
jgi:zinc protease